jgi:predicted nucleotidyltransferase
MRRPKDRDFVETEEGFIFCLLGSLHPPDRYTAYLKYTPAETGRWTRGTVHFCRELEYYHVRNVVKTLTFLRTHHPRYVGFDPVLNVSFSFVPRDAVTIYYRPEERLQAIMAGPADPLEKDVEALVRLLVAAGGPDLEAFGITGSILLQIHNPSFSDIDLLVYGQEATAKVRAAATLLKGGPLQAVAPDRLTRWRAETAERFDLTLDDVAYLEARRWNYFQFQNRYVSIHPTRRDDEIQEVYGQRHYRTVGVATIEATVVDATDSIFLPAHYTLADVVIREQQQLQITEVISYEALYCQAADPGDRIVARGVVEQVDDGPCRLVLGAAALSDGGSLRLRRTHSQPAP